MEETGTEIATTEPGVGADDRLSSLPDEVISHILSFLPTKYAVGTVILSRRWKDLWTRVSNLDFDNSLTYQPLPGHIAFEDYKQLEHGQCRLLELEILNRRALEFSRFVCRVLSEHKNLHSVRLFRFHFSLQHSERQVSPCAWFDREWVFGSLVEEIDMVLDGEMEYQLPYCLLCLPQSFYTLMNLKVVKLKGVRLTAAKGPVLLPSLKILQLCEVDIEDFETLSSLISGCPVLETVILEGGCLSYRNEQDILVISLPSLKNLKIIRFHYKNLKDIRFHFYGMCPIVIGAPNLEELHLEEFAELKIVDSSPLSCLHSAHVNIYLNEFVDHHLLDGVLNQLTNAKKIFLSGQTMSRLSTLGDIQLPDFPNLTHLTIQTWGNSQILQSLLHSASKLHTLVIDMETPVRPMQWKTLELLQTPACLLSSLEEIEVKNLVASEDEMKMVAYFLEAGIVLKKVNIHVHCEVGILGCRRLASIVKLPRGSNHCEVRLLLPNNEEICIYIDSETDLGDDMHDECFYHKEEETLKQ